MKRMKKTMALLLSLVMMLTMGVTSLAANKTTTLTIATKENHTYKVYQLLKGDVSELINGSGKLSNIEKGSSLKNAENVSAETIVESLKDKEQGELGNAAFSYIDNSKPVNTITGNGAQQSVTVEEGYYVVTDEHMNSPEAGTFDPVSRYLVAVVGPTTMEPKVIKEPVFDKKIIDTDKNAPIDGEYGKTDTAAIGDTIEYEVSGVVPNHEGYTYYYYVVNDTLSKGLTLDENSFDVKIGNTSLVKGTDYFVYVTNNEDGTTTFKLGFANMKAYNADEKISVKYNAIVNENAVIGTDANTNTVKLEYSNNPNVSEKNDEKPGLPSSNVPTGTTPNKVTKTYVTELKLLKVDGEGNKLTGAEFTLVGSNLTKIKFTTGDSYEVNENGEYWKLKDGTYTKENPNTEGMDQSKYESVTTKYKKATVVTAQENSMGNKSVTAFVDENGYIQFTGLDAGEYTLKETKTPVGYNTISDIEFTISATQNGANDMEGGNIQWSSNNEQLKLNGNTFEITVVNRTGTVLPSTGGIGTTIFYVMGSILVLGAAVILVTKNRMKMNR